MRAFRLFCLALCAVLACASLAGCALRRGGEVNTQPSEAPTQPPAEEERDEGLEEAMGEVTHIDAQAYYQEKAQVVSATPARESSAVRTEKDAVSDLRQRGFEQFPVTSDYAADGSFGGDEALSGDGEDRRPIYETQYVTADEQLWTIYEINGAVMAYPASYNAESGRDVPLMLSETGRVMSYDGDTGTYFETIPNPDEMRVEQVARIDARTLEQWTKEALDRL